MAVKEKKKRSSYFCMECGYEAYQWLGKCPDCNQWNTFSESKAVGTTQTAAISLQTGQLKRLGEIESIVAERVVTGLGELDRVLGGGIVPGATILLGGDPGVGKSTLLLKASVMAANQLARQAGKNKVLYIAAEESEASIKQRAVRLGLEAEEFYVISETNTQTILAWLKETSPKIVILDSIQAVADPEMGAGPAGSLVQVRESAVAFCQFARTEGAAVFLVGHVTKDGALAGPKSLEHLVDTVLYFEGDRYDHLRLLRSVKNRHGATGEIGIFEMREKGLVEVANPSQYFLTKEAANLPGRATVALIEGRQPFLVELQALVNQTQYNNPIRRSLGMELNKVTLLVAVMEKSLGIHFSHFDLFSKSAGGMNVSDPAADLALVVSVLSSFKQKTIPADFLFIGEVGLGGEIRRVRQLPARLAEASRLGFKQAFIPKGNAKGLEGFGMSLVEVGQLTELYSLLF